MRLQYDNFQYTNVEITFNILLWFVSAGLLYLNNLLLVPLLLARKRLYFYLPLVSLAIFGAARLSAFLITIAAKMQSNISLFKIAWIPVASEAPMRTDLTTVVHVLFFTIEICIFSLCWYLIEYQKNKGELAETKRKQTETELAFLKHQLNPHFLFNTLNNLYSLALKKSDDTADSIAKLSVIMRYLLYESNVPTVAFAKEKAIMMAYIELEKLRLDNTSNMHFVINADKDYKLPPLLWMPILENVFKYGTGYISDNLYLEYHCTINNNIMVITAKNAYKDNTARNSASGIGLVNMEKRLQLLYPGKHKVSIVKEKGLYQITLEIQLA